MNPNPRRSFPSRRPPANPRPNPNWTRQSIPELKPPRGKENPTLWAFVLAGIVSLAILGGVLFIIVASSSNYGIFDEYIPDSVLNDVYIPDTPFREDGDFFDNGDGDFIDNEGNLNNSTNQTTTNNTVVNSTTNTTSPSLSGKGLIADSKIYLGVMPINLGGGYEMERITGQKVAMLRHWPTELISGGEGRGALSLDIAAAEQAWNAGYLIRVHAYEPGIGANRARVEEILNGDFDAELSAFAADIRAFGKPMIFDTTSEPNGGSRGMGGWGPNGDQPENYGGSLTSHFDPSGLPNSQLYAGLGNDSVDDALERLAAVQRYYYDFFKNKEGLDFLTFTSIGWLATIEPDIQSSRGTADDFLSFHEGVMGYYDWISINWYYSLGGTQALDHLLGEMYKLDPTTPIMITELGFCNQLGHDYRDQSIVTGFDHMINNHPNIKGVFFTHQGGSEGDCRLSEGKGAEELLQVNAQHGGIFESCPKFSDGSTIPGCTSTPGTLFQPPNPNELENPTCYIYAEGGTFCDAVSNCPAPGEFVNFASSCGLFDGDCTPGGLTQGGCCINAHCSQVFTEEDFSGGNGGGGNETGGTCTDTTGFEVGVPCSSAAFCTGEFDNNCCLGGAVCNE